MKHILPTVDEQGRLATLEGYEVSDSATLSVWNEEGDIVARVIRPDGSIGCSYGGPVYDPPEFLNTGQRCQMDLDDCRRPCGCASYGMTPAERSLATSIATRVGWMS